jgi:hypothetical protein
MRNSKRYKTVSEQIEFWDKRVSPFWEPNVFALGLGAGYLNSMSDALADTKAKYEAALIAREEAKMATLALHQSLGLLNKKGSAIVQTIRAKAKADDNPNLYVLADIRPPAAPTPSGIAPVPRSLEGFIDNDGNVVISWKGSLAHATFFTVWRRLPGETEWTQLGSVRSRKFHDTSLEAGTPAASYKVFAVRSSGTSEGSEILTVVFGTQGQLAA